MELKTSKTQQLSTSLTIEQPNKLLVLICMDPPMDFEKYIDHALAAGGDINYFDPCYNMSLLTMACFYKQLEVVKKLLRCQANPNINIKTNPQNLPIFSAQSLEVVRLLVENGAEVKVKGPLGHTPLHIACLRSDVELAEFYIKNGVPVNEPNDWGQIPAHYAFTRLIIRIPSDVKVSTPPRKSSKNKMTLSGLSHSQKCAELISEYKSEYEKEHQAKDRDRVCSELFHIQSGTPRTLSVPLIKSLLDHGADADFPDKSGFTPVDYSKINRCHNIIIKAINGIDYFDYEIFQAMRAGKSQVVMSWLNKGGDPNIVERCGMLLHQAATNGDGAVVQKLLDEGATVDAQLTPEEFKEDYFYNLTPLFAVCERVNSSQSRDVIRRLLIAGADINRPCQDTMTPFLKLCESQQAQSIWIMIDHAFDQLMSGTLLHKMSKGKEEEKFRPVTFKPRTKNDIGNLALKFLCRMYISSDNNLQNAISKQDNALYAHEKAIAYRQAYTAMFSQAGKDYLRNKIPEKSLDSALQRSHNSSRALKKIRNQMCEATDRVGEVVDFRRTDEYKVSMQRLGKVIQRLFGMVKPNEHVQKLINSNDKLTALTEIDMAS